MVPWLCVSIAKEQVEILESLCYEEALLDVILEGIGIVDNFYATVATTRFPRDNAALYS